MCPDASRHLQLPDGKHGAEGWEWGGCRGKGGSRGHLVGGLGCKSKNKPAENEVMVKLFTLMMD